MEQARKTLSEYGQADAVAVMRRHLLHSGPPEIVVVGEVKRGKSTLVNALTGAMVSPSSASLPTTSVVIVVPPGPELPQDRAELIYYGRTDVVDADEAVRKLVPTDDWETDAPIMARFAREHRWLPGAILVDTPGVGGLDSSQGRRARTAATEATALVFVTDGGQPLTAPELAFLRELGEGTEHVVLVLTKIDRNPGSWQTIREENRRLLRQHAPRFADHEIHAVSAAYAVHALSQAPDLAAQLAQASGLPGLAQALLAIMSDQHRMSMANALRVGASGLQRIELGLEEEMRALQTVDARQDLEAEHDRVAELQLRQRRGKLDLERDLGRVRQASVRYATQRADEVLADFSARIKKSRLGMKASVRNQFAADLAAELGVLASDVHSFTEERLTTFVTATFDSLAEMPTVPGFETGLGDLTPRVRQRPTYAMNPFLDPSLAGTAFVGAKISTMLLGGPLGWAAGIVGGSAMLGLNAAFRGARQGQQELAGTLAETINSIKSELIGAIDEWIRELRPELHIALEDYLKQAMATVQGLLNEGKKAQRAGEVERAKKLEQLQRRHSALQMRRGVVESRLQELASREHSGLPPSPTVVTTANRQEPDTQTGSRP